MASRRSGSIAGVVLAGGRSSRMGQDKAFLSFGGRPLINHMADLLYTAGVGEVFISGRQKADIPYAGYGFLPDTSPFSGPAAAIRDVMAILADKWKGVLFVPVDMPLLMPVQLQRLMAEEGGGWFCNWPLPAYLPVDVMRPVSNAASVRGLLSDWKIAPLEPDAADMKRLVNANTVQEWQEIAV